MSFRRDVERLLRSFELLRHDDCLVIAMRDKGTSLPVPIRDDDMRLAQSHRFGGGVKFPKWSTSHHLASNSDRVFLPIEQASSLVVSNWQSFESLFDRGCTPEYDGFSWVDVVLALLEKSESALVDKPKWFVPVNSQCHCALNLWSKVTANPERLEARPMVGLTLEDIERIGPDPECVFLKRKSFIDDSILVIGDLLETLDEKQTVAPEVVPVDFMPPYSLDRTNRTLVWFGERFETLERNPFQVIEVLYDAFVKGFQWVTLDKLRADCPDVRALDRGMAEVFNLRIKQGRKRKRPNSKHPIYKWIEKRGGTTALSYRLKPVDEIRV